MFIASSCGGEDENPANAGVSSAVFNESLSYGTMQDNEGISYKTIEIGNQVWMAENLRSTQFRNGETITEVTTNSEWVGLTSAAYSTYDNTTDLDEQATNGMLYNWLVVSDSREIAPAGWRVPTEQDWINLANAIGGVNSAAGALKEAGVEHWASPNAGANNSTGFTAQPAGRREYTDGSFINAGFNAFWWTSTAYNPDYSWYFQMNYDGANLLQANFHKQYGFSIRLVKD